MPLCSRKNLRGPWLKSLPANYVIVVDTATPLAHCVGEISRWNRPVGIAKRMGSWAAADVVLLECLKN